MTWIKPSCCWMMYRARYSHKDKGQSHILALKMKHERFHQLLAAAEEDNMRLVRVQWDPERTPALEVLPYRSIQIGISNQLSRKWVDEWIVSIEDVTSMATALKKTIDSNGTWTLDDLMARVLAPREDVYDVSEELRLTLKMENFVDEL